MSLHLDAVHPDLFALLKQLMQLECLGEFYLVGGTALALRLGHRESVDIDLFTSTPFDSVRLMEELRESVSLAQAETSKNTVRGVARGIKVEWFAHQYPLLAAVETIEGIRIACIKDLAAFKGNAIANRGAKKDFWDLHALLQLHTKSEIFSFCGEKYQGESIWNLEKSMVYFDDADLDPDPKDLQGFTWEQIKREIIECVKRHE